MALFKKPKRNIRQRNVELGDEENSEEVSESMQIDVTGNGVKNLKEKVRANDKKQKLKLLLSFADDEEENGEVFKVKKTSYSKRLERKLEKEKRRRNDKKEIDDDEIPKDTIKALPIEDLPVVVQKEKERENILNGRAALMAGKNDASSSEDDEGSTRYKFSHSKRAEIMIESGKIPDAATIHAARKRRERARQLNVDFIPIKSNISQPKPLLKGKSRLVREEEEEEEGSDEERISMGMGLEANDLTARRANYYEHVEHGAEGELADEMIYCPDPQSVQLQPGMGLLGPHPLPPPPPPPPPCFISKELAQPEVISKRLQERLDGLKEIHSLHCNDVERVSSEMKQHTAEMERLEGEAPALAAKFRFYQDMRGYVTDLVECLDEKVPGLIKLEESSMKLWCDRAANFCGRRRLDVRDQADEMSQLPKNPAVVRWSREEEEARSRRAAEREGRRARRRRGREQRSLAAPHFDGMSSDDEETELEASSFQKKIDEIERLGSGLLEDVESEFGTVNGVAQRLERWREFDITAYEEAYASLCLPKILGPFIRLHLLTWNPLQDALDIEKSSWWSRLLTYGFREGETIESLQKDPDLLLIPVVIEKAILPKISDLVNSVWDPLSCSQTQRLVNFLKKFIVEMPGITSRSGQLNKLLESVLKRLRHAVDNDVFIPISYVGGEGKSRCTPFFQRQFASAVKLLRNMLSLQGIVDVTQLHEIALDSLLNRYLLAALRSCSPCDSINKANMIISTFPRWWFQNDTVIPKLQMLGRQLKLLSTQVQSYDVTEKDAYELVQSLVRTIQLACPEPL